MPPPRPDFSYLRQPQSKLGKFFWRKRMWFEANLSLSMLEPWEKITVACFLTVLLTLLLTGLFKYLPQHLHVMQRRAVYYLSGEEDETFLWHWIGSVMHIAKQTLGLHDEL
ncbi:hypothetical protein BDN72DRAFT_819418 [Pluteus cervinus]|uniref:Uncharacterized protein n=1 Tax=Pluteus cervinus TaxID=181527 RepID=A0ACD3AW78_9AGAR|nr:hypothetical protein BDN72DRAFT_819418 [Pluteus cervinus]